MINVNHYRLLLRLLPGQQMSMRTLYPLAGLLHADWARLCSTHVIGGKLRHLVTVRTMCTMEDSAISRPRHLDKLMSLSVFTLISL